MNSRRVIGGIATLVAFGGSSTFFLEFYKERKELRAVVTSGPGSAHVTFLTDTSVQGVIRIAVKSSTDSIRVSAELQSQRTHVSLDVDSISGRMDGGSRIRQYFVQWPAADTTAKPDSSRLIDWPSTALIRVDVGAGFRDRPEIVDWEIDGRAGKLASMAIARSRRNQSIVMLVVLIAGALLAWLEYQERQDEKEKAKLKERAEQEKAEKERIENERAARADLGEMLIMNVRNTDPAVQNLMHAVLLKWWVNGDTDAELNAFLEATHKPTQRHAFIVRAREAMSDQLKELIRKFDERMLRVANAAATDTPAEGPRAPKTKMGGATGDG